MTEKSTLSSLWKQDLKKVKVETEKVNKLLINIPTGHFSEANKLIYARMKIV